MSKAELDFVNEMTRKLLVKWAHQTLVGGIFTWTTEQEVYYNHARDKGWVSKKEDKVLASGFSSAASFMRR